MVALASHDSPTVEAIYTAYAGESSKQRPRAHLGASQIGQPCRRALWYAFRWHARPAFSGRTLRLFETGKREEERVYNNLRAIGATVHEVDPATGRQFSYADHGGHFCGSMDGALQGIPEAPATWHALEIKTHNAKSFGKLKDKGVQVVKPEHLMQMQVYMGWSGLERALYFAVCKDTDELYCERVPANDGAFQGGRLKALMVIEAATPPDRHETLCEWCEYREVCAGNRLPLVNCRTCVYATPVTTGTGAHWTCTRDNHDIPVLLQERGCDHHLFIPESLPFPAVERGDGFAVYQAGAGYFVNSTPSAFPACSVAHYRSDELVRVPLAELGR